MSRSIGLRLAADELHAVLVERRGRGVRVLAATRTPLSATRPLEEALREVAVRLGGDRLPVGVAPAAGEGWLKLVALPPLRPADRARLLEMEADRYFPVRGEPVLVDLPAEGPVAGARAAVVEALVARVEEVVGPVRAVHPAARGTALAWARLDPTLRQRVYAVVSRDGPWWELVIARGGTLLGHARLHSPEPQMLVEALLSAVRPGGVEPRVLLVGEPGADPTAMRDALRAGLPDAEIEVRDELLAGVPAALAPAVGLALAPAGGLLPAAHRARLGSAARRRTALWLAAAVVAALALAGVGSWRRAQGEAERSAQAAQLAPRADSASRLLARTQQVHALARLTDSLAAARPDWLGVLAELTRRLPQGAYITQLSGQAESGVIEVRGYAGSVAGILPRLEQSPRFSGVESVEAVTRRTVGGVELENFALRMKVER